MKRFFQIFVLVSALVSTVTSFAQSVHTATAVSAGTGVERAQEAESDATGRPCELQSRGAAYGRAIAGGASEVLDYDASPSAEIRKNREKTVSSYSPPVVIIGR